MQEVDLTKRNFVLAIDRSGSMSEMEKGRTRWETAMESVMAIVKKCCDLDSDGIDLFFFNTQFKEYNNVGVEKAQQLIKDVEPNGGTDFVPFLTKAIDNHFKNADKPTTILVVTDGEPSNGATGQKAVAKLIVETANKIEADNDLSLSFFQIGSDPAATKFLKALDDDLQGAGAKFDIVDTKTFAELENMSITEALLASVQD